MPSSSSTGMGLTVTVTRSGAEVASRVETTNSKVMSMGAVKSAGAANSGETVVAAERSTSGPAT